MLAYITRSVNGDSLRRIEYLQEENRVVCNHLQKKSILLTYKSDSDPRGEGRGPRYTDGRKRPPRSSRGSGCKNSHTETGKESACQHCPNAVR
jgi:hypothetical protein